MKNKFRLFMLAPMIFSVMGCKPAEQSSGTPIDVVIISGQSNGVGCTWCNQIPDSMGIEKYSEYQQGYKDIKMSFCNWTKNFPDLTFEIQNASRDKFVDVRLGQGNGTHSFGPEIGIAEAMHTKYANKLFLIKAACGGSNLKDDWLNKKTSYMYQRFIDYIRKQMNILKESGYFPTIKAFCWMQGEGDSYPGYYNVYQDNLRTFVTNVRSDLRDLSGEKEMAFIDAGINNYPARWQYWQEVNEAKKAFANESENNFYIDTIAAGMHTDQEPRENIDRDHYDSESEVLLGKLFAQAFEPFLMKENEKESK